MDDSEADFYKIKDRSEHLFHIAGSSLGKKTGVSGKPEFYGKVLAEIKRRSEDVRKMVIAGPGFAKDEIKHLIKEKAKEIYDKLIFDGLSHTGDVGLQELLRRGLLEKITELSRISEETNLVEKLLEEMVKEGKVVYGLEETKKALESGAVSTLLISDKKVREWEELIEGCEKVGTKVVIVSSTHQSGEKLFGIGGIAGFLRYRI